MVEGENPNAVGTIIEADSNLDPTKQEHPEKRRLDAIQLSQHFIKYIKLQGFNPDNLSSSDFEKIVKLLIKDNQRNKSKDMRFIPAYRKIKNPDQEIFERFWKVYESCKKCGDFEPLNMLVERLLKNEPSIDTYR